MTVKVRKTLSEARPTVTTTTSKKSAKAKSAGRRSAKGIAQVQAVLLALMSGSASDAVRVSAAKTLLDKLLRDDAEGDEAQRHEADEREAAIAEAAVLLAELAEGMSGGVREPSVLAPDGAAATTDSAG